MFYFHQWRILNCITICLAAGLAVVFVFPCLGVAEDKVFANIKAKTLYMKVEITFEIEEGSISYPSIIEVLRAARKSGDYQIVGTVGYDGRNMVYKFWDESVEKTAYFYKLKVGRTNITSTPFKGKALLVPPGT